MPKNNTSPRTPKQIEAFKEYRANLTAITKPPKADQPPMTIDLSKMDTSKLQTITKGAK
ncbi:hypothetical protein UFOVP338_43 [uncultured Caudovirales phage]|uniref:Uncharacterized protein n=1 Tax=uncultured Caudovirales phage TaxID=2100421 RepID=A0A6J5LY65_9CAUD|nr:hypothetical protein UFOVP338_43 [uncultured Caudovirales phage]